MHLDEILLAKLDVLLFKLELFDGSLFRASLSVTVGELALFPWVIEVVLDWQLTDHRKRITKDVVSSVSTACDAAVDTLREAESEPPAAQASVLTASLAESSREDAAVVGAVTDGWHAVGGIREADAQQEQGNLGQKE